jgi:hypothetical protein
MVLRKPSRKLPRPLEYRRQHIAKEGRVLEERLIKVFRRRKVGALEYVYEEMAIIVKGVLAKVIAHLDIELFVPCHAVRAVESREP